MTPTVIDISRDNESDEITQFTIIDDSGQPQLVKGTAENLLLYDPEEELPFEDGLYGFLSGDDALILSDDPEIIVAPTDNEYCYILRVNENTVETTPRQAEDTLEGIRQAATRGKTNMLVQLYQDIMAEQVRRPVINALFDTFDETDRINVISRGWLVDEMYLINWEASMYLRHNDPDEGDYKRGSGGVTQTDKSYEFVQLNLRRDIDPVQVNIGGETYRLTEREMLFLSKVKWLLNRREYHPDKPFWMFSDRQGASVDWKTGEPEDNDTDEPDKDSFNL